MGALVAPLAPSATTTTTTTTTLAPTSPPTAVTGPASSVSLAGASFTGNVDPNGASTTWYFQYGTTTGYGSTTAAHVLGGGSTSVAVIVAVTGLTPGTTYHFRLVATSAAGTTDGRDATVTTSQSAPGVATTATTAVGAAGATVHGSVDPDGLATVWYVRYGTSSSYGSQTRSTSVGSGLAAVAVSEVLSGLHAATTYHFQLVATNAVGTSYGADETFATLGAPTVTTEPPTAVGASGADLRGVVDPNGLATSWYVRYGTTTRYGLTTRATSIGSGHLPVQVSASVGGLRGGTTYHYSVVASSAAGIAYGADESFVTVGAPRDATGHPASVGPFAARVTGTVDPAGATVSWYFEYGPTPSYGHATAATSIGPASASVPVSALLTGLAPGRTYHFRLVATGPGGTTYGSDSSLSTPGPALALAGRSPSITTVTFGRAVRLVGAVPSGQAGASVELMRAPRTGGRFVRFATARTGAGGRWALATVPPVATVYLVVWDGAASRRVVAQVRPEIFLRPAAGGRFVSRVVDRGALAGRLLRLQRLVGGRWRAVGARRTNARGLAVFGPRLPAGVSRLRVMLTGYQAGPGYLTGTSAVHLVRRR